MCKALKSIIFLENPALSGTLPSAAVQGLEHELMDYRTIKIEFLNAVIAERSTLLISQKLGYSFDQVKRWMTESKELRWDEFCDLCEVLQLPLSEVLRDIFQFTGESPEDTYLFVLHLRNSIHRFGLQSICDSVGVHPSVMRRYLKGEVFPSIEIVMALMDLNKNILGSFWIRLVGSQVLGPLQKYFGESRGQQEVETNWPLACAVEGLLATEEYKALPNHDEYWFCSKLDISRDEFQALWSNLVAHDQVRPEGPNKFMLNYQTINTNGVSSQQVCRMVEFWTERAKRRFTFTEKPINKKNTPNIVTYRIVPMSRAAMKQATDIILKANQEIIALAESQSGPYEDVRVIMMHHFSVEDFSEPAEKVTVEGKDETSKKIASEPRP